MITDYISLIEEVTHRAGIESIPERAATYVLMAEQYLSKHVRLSKMESNVALVSDANGEITLPGDFVEMRMVVVNSCELQRIGLDVKLNNTRMGYAVIANKLISTFKEAEHDLLYYAAIPSIQTNNTSWLLNDEPELYIQAILFQVYTGNNEIERAQATLGYLKQMIDAVNQSDYLKIYSGTSVYLGENIF